MITIKKVNSTTDLDAITLIYEKSFDKFEGIINKYYQGFPNYVKFCENQGYSYMAFIDDEPCGVLLAYKTPDMMYGEEIYIELLAVLPEHQKKGVGTKLLDTLKKQATENGFRRLSIRTACYMDSYDIYKKYGFKDSRSDIRYMSLVIKNDNPVSENQTRIKEKL